MKQKAQMHNLYKKEEGWKNEQKIRGNNNEKKKKKSMLLIGLSILFVIVIALVSIFWVKKY